jgi:hypothetical protein
MATYKGINGFAVQSLATDPTFDEGQVWYNNASYVWKVSSIATVGTWATSPNLPAATSTGGAAGIQTAALTFGLPGPPGSAPTLISQSWNGTVWTVTPSLPRGGDYTNGFGTQTAAVSCGDGRPVDANYSNLWNGSSWTTGNPLTQYGYAGVGLGIQTAGMLAARYDGTIGITNFVELFNGTTWSNNPADLNTSRYNPQASGTQTTALIFGGQTSTAQSSATESYNGTSWTTLPGTLNTARSSGAGSGTQTNAICFAGTTNPTAATGATELWNGSSWSNNPSSMSVARAGINNTMGTQTGSLALGAGPANISVESWSGPGSQVNKTITTS